MPTGDADLDAVIDEYQQAARQFARGDPEGVKRLFSRADDVLLANPFGPAVRGWAHAEQALEFASSQFRDGDVSDFEVLATYRSAELVTMHALERWSAKVGGRDDVRRFDLRVTTTLRRQDGVWRIVHRHADPIATAAPEGPLRRS